MNLDIALKKYCFGYGEPQQAEILRDDSPWDKEGFRLNTYGFVEPLAKK